MQTQIARQQSGPTGGLSVSLEKNTINSTNLTVFSSSDPQKHYKEIDNKMDVDGDPEDVDLEDTENHWGINGISNLGNTCYVNATLQCLFRVQPLRDYFLNGLHIAELNPNNTKGSGGKLAKAYGELLG